MSWVYSWARRLQHQTRVIFHPCLWRGERVFWAKAWSFPNRNQVVFQPNPNQTLTTALSQHKSERRNETFEWKQAKVSTYLWIAESYSANMYSCSWVSAGVLLQYLGRRARLGLLWFVEEILQRKANLNLWLTCHVEDAVTGADVGQEGITQALASVSTFHQASDVNDIKECWDFAATQEVRGENIIHSIQYNSPCEKFSICFLFGQISAKQCVSFCCCCRLH